MRAKERTHSGHYANVALFLPTEEKPEDMSYTHTRNVTQKRKRDSPQTSGGNSMRFLHQSSPHQWLWHNEIASVLKKSGGQEVGGSQGKNPWQWHLLFGPGILAADPTLGSKTVDG